MTAVPDQDRVWNRIPDNVAARSSTWRWIFQNCRRESWRVRFTDERKIFCLGGIGLSATEGA